MSNTAKSDPQGFFGSSVFQIVAFLVVFSLGCILVSASAMVVVTLDLNPLWIMPPAILSMLLILGGAAVMTIWVASVSAREMDAVFVPLGLTGKSRMFGLCQYHGVIGERQVDVRFSRSPYLEIQVSTPLTTRLAVALKTWDMWMMGPLMRKSRLTFEDSRLNDMVIRAWDEPWTRTVLARPDVVEPLCRLIRMKGAWLYRMVGLNSGKLRFWLTERGRVSWAEIAPDAARQCLEDLLTLAEALEQASAPQVVIEETRWEKLSHSMGDPDPRVVTTIISLTTAFLCCGWALIVMILFSTIAH